MRQTLFFLSILLISCSQSESTGSENVRTITQSDSLRSERKALIEELKLLNRTISSNDPAKIADLFKFPLADTAMGIYIDDSVYNAQLQYSNGQTTRSMFVAHFPAIYKSIQLDELNRLFESINPDNLLGKDTLQFEAHSITEPCLKFYAIEVQGNIVTLTTGQGVNENYKSPKTTETDIPENSSEFCESVIWWVFRFNGNKFDFVKQHGAG